MNKPKKRYEEHLRSFEKKLQLALAETNSGQSNAIGQLLHAKDGRTPMFQLQGLARIDSKIGKDKKKAELWLEQFKAIEDALGKFDYWNAMIQNNKGWNFPGQISLFFEQQAYYWLGVMEERLIRFGWLKNGPSGLEYSEEAIEKLLGSIRKTEFYEPKKERKKLLELYRDEAMEIHEKVKGKEINLDEIEEGVHEFRRKLRWLGIYSSSLLGKVRISKSKAKDPLSQFVNKEKAALKFNQLPLNENQEEPVFFIRGGFYAMSDLISEIGEIKDPGLATEEMLRLGKRFGLDDSSVRGHLGKDYIPHTEVVEKASALIHKYLFEDEILLHIAGHFDEQLR